MAHRRPCAEFCFYFSRPAKPLTHSFALRSHPISAMTAKSTSRSSTTTPRVPDSASQEIIRLSYALKLGPSTSAFVFQPCSSSPSWFENHIKQARGLRADGQHHSVSFMHAFIWCIAWLVKAPIPDFRRWNRSWWWSLLCWFQQLRNCFHLAILICLLKGFPDRKE